eukprot:3250749-Lingulodinium_polyedra.AAC.1
MRDAEPAVKARWAVTDWLAPGALQAEVAIAEATFKGAAVEARAKRVRGWHQWVQDALADGGRLYKWIRVGGPPAAGLAPDPNCEPQAIGPGGVQVGPRRWLVALQGGPAA